MKYLRISIIFILFGLLLTTCNVKKPALSRQGMIMPRLVKFDKFRIELPIEDLRYFRSRESTSQLFNYFFVVDKAGDVVDGKFDQSVDANFNFLKKYIENTFSHYKWNPAYYKSNVPEKLKTVLKLSIYDDRDKNVFDITVRLMYLPEKEKLDDIFEEKNLIYKLRIR